MEIRFLNAGPEAERGGSDTRGWAGIKFLNAYPLVRGLEDDLPEWKRFIASPVECASLLDAGKVDLALVPLATAVANRWPFLRDIGIACRGRVDSVKFISHVERKLIKSFRPDPASGTSNILARLLYNVENGRDIIPDAASEEAEIVIGDRAFEADDVEQVDLGKAWHDETGLPFVFGVWAARDERVLRDLGPILIARLHNNLRNADTLIYGGSRLTGKLINIQDYLYHKLHYTLGEMDQLGMTTFLDLAHKYGFISTSQPRIVSADSVSASRRH